MCIIKHIPKYKNKLKKKKKDFFFFSLFFSFRIRFHIIGGGEGGCVFDMGLGIIILISSFFSLLHVCMHHA